MDRFDVTEGTIKRAELIQNRAAEELGIDERSARNAAEIVEGEDKRK